MASINYPTQEWLDEWVDKWLDDHPDEKVDNFDDLKAQAEEAWWMNEIDHNRPTPDDLTEEQEKVSQEARKGMAKSDKERKPVKRERKPNPDKRGVIVDLAEFLTNDGMVNVVVTNPEKTIDFTIGDKHYTLMLTCHRPPKSDK